MRNRYRVGLLLLGAIPLAQAAASDCAVLALPPATTARATLAPPLAVELLGINTDLGAPSGVLASGYDENLSVDRVLLRQRVEACRQVAMSAPPIVVNTNDPAAYKPKTEFDNTPYRFNMTQNGKKMTADDFDAWLKATGYSAGRRANPTTPAAAAVPAAPAAAKPE
ncbi:MAG: hypothetical protein QM599_06390 [Pseudoxanthomonas sp.]